jgi:hypothetical protein
MADLATITLVSETIDDATFTVEYVGKPAHGHQSDPRYSLWLSFESDDADGTRNGLAEVPVNQWVNNTSVVTVAKPGGGPTFQAFVWQFPDPSTPVSNTSSFS